MGYKAYSDSYLMSLTKAQIIELLRVAEHNFFATEEALNNSAKAGMEIAEKYDRTKELLKSATGIIKDIDCNEDYLCDECEYRAKCDGSFSFYWHYANEIEKLLNDEK